MKFNQVKFQDSRTRTYLGSPSLIRLNDGTILATHDYFGKGCPKNHQQEEHLTSVYRSEDHGQSWQNTTHIANAFWSTLFKHRGDVYLLGCSQQYGSIVIHRSTDGGFTWTYPKDADSGLLLAGGAFREPPNYHCAPMPVVEKSGRLYRAFEDCTPCVWGTGFQSFTISAEADANLLSAQSWTISNKIPFDPGWIPDEWSHTGTQLEKPGWLEGNIVISPNDEIWNILRFNSRPLVDKAAIVKVEEGGRQVSFDPATGFIDFPGGMSKFSIRYDPSTQHYLTLSNNNTDPNFPVQRNELSLCVSTDLINWQHKLTLIEDDSELDLAESVRLIGFQYVDWQFDERDLIYLVRTAYDGAHNYHDANRITFHRLSDFQKYILN